MNPIYFKEHNKVIGVDQNGVLPLPVYNDGLYGGQTIHCWGVTLCERIKILFTGRIWVSVLAYNQPLQPIAIDCDSPFKDEEKFC